MRICQKASRKAKWPTLYNKNHKVWEQESDALGIQKSNGSRKLVKIHGILNSAKYI